MVDFCHGAILGGITAAMSMNPDDPVTLQSLYSLLMVMTSRIDAVAGDVHDLKSDVHAMKESNKSTSSSGRRIPCPLGCGTDFKRVREHCELRFRAPSLTLQTGELLVRSFVQSY